MPGHTEAAFESANEGQSSPCSGGVIRQPRVQMRRGGRNSNNRLVSPHLEADNDIVWRTATEHVPALEAAPAHERDKCHGGQGE